jgi:hypothetical protein
VLVGCTISSTSMDQFTESYRESESREALTEACREESGREQEGGRNFHTGVFSPRIVK